MSQPQIPPLWPDDKYIGSAGGPMFEMANGKRYAISSTLAAIRPTITRDERIALTKYVMDHGGAIPAPVTTENLDAILNRGRIPTKEKAWRLIREIVRELGGKPGTVRWQFSPHDPAYLNRLRNIEVDMDDELRSLLDYVERTGFVSQRKMVGGPIDIELTVAGLIQFEAEAESSDSSNAFVAMWFSDQMNEAYEAAIAPAIESWGYSPVRVDRREHNNKIDDEIISEIRRARFVVADFSCGDDGARGGVYYEAGFAAGLGKPVIFSVRQADLDRVHFDTRQFNHIVWESIDDFRTGLGNRIGATIGQNKS